jgi:cardiolipin synthase A/B
MAIEFVLALCTVVLCVLLLLVLFEPSLRYHAATSIPEATSGAFLRVLSAITDSEVRDAETVEVLTNGGVFYEAELAAIRKAGNSIHIEAFIFHPSEIGDRFLAALTERAQAGVTVRVVVDAIGSLPTPDRYFATLRAAGGRVAWYQPIRWYTLKRFNNRTHREIIVVDGTIGFVGGAGIASHWLETKQGNVPWRDTMLRVSGSLAAGLQTTFAENWLESTGEILADATIFPEFRPSVKNKAGLVVIGTPSPARSSRVRVLFQVLLAAARESIDINSPYFLPDPSARRELIAAADRGVRVRVITPGSANNHPVARRASRRRYGELLKAEVEIYEFQPGMIHAKILVVDGLVCVVGSTNFDSRSFDLNDEVGMAVSDRALAARLNVDFERDRALSQPVTYAQWENRPLAERVLAMLGLFLERQE